MNEDFHRSSPPRIDVAQAWAETTHHWVDVRVPMEFVQGAVPGAVNIPLFSDGERETIGTLYRRFGRKSAIEEGYRNIQPRLDEFLEHFKKLGGSKPITVVCARGGMRSQSVAALLLSRGFQARQLLGGYKAFRNFTLESLENFRFSSPLLVLQGKTGVGKTIILSRLSNALDLEGLAQHRSSLFGGIGKTPATQKSFEGNLLKKLEELDPERPIFVEGESRKVGPVQIPAGLFRQIRAGRMILLEADIERRVERTIQNYVNLTEKNREELAAAVNQLRPLIGNEAAGELLGYLRDERYENAVRLLYTRYYDPKYAHAMKKYHFSEVISTNRIDDAIKSLRSIQENLQFRTEPALSEKIP